MTVRIDIVNRQAQTLAQSVLSAPTTVKALQTNEVYRLDLVWSLNSGP